MPITLPRMRVRSVPPTPPETTPPRMLEMFKPAPAAGPAEDARTLSVLRQSNGERFRSLQSVAEHCAEMVFDD